jgi:3-methyladenine DNA glycosylase/8-oxoguanine DNA glycosylase
VSDLIPCLWSEPGTAPIDWAAACRELTASDRALGRVIQRVGGTGFPPSGRVTAFEALAHSIVYQQLSGKAAATIFSRFRALFPDPAFPDPQAILAMPHPTLRSAGLSEAKARAIRDLAQHAEIGTIPPVDRLRRMPPEEVVKRLTVVRGVGRWTVEMLLLFRLGHPDVLPAHDLGIRKGLARISKRRELPEPEAVTRRGERWRPYRSVASWYLWRATELPRAATRRRSR